MYLILLDSDLRLSRGFFFFIDSWKFLIGSRKSDR